MTKDEFIKSLEVGLIKKWAKSNNYQVFTEIDNEAFTVIGELDVVGEDLQFEINMSYYCVKNNSPEELVFYMRNKIAFWVKYKDCSLCVGNAHTKDCSLCHGSKVVERKAVNG